ncbi:hypothetical protein SRHO_G00274330 [Serrasalmus rhombeus]
MASLGHTPYHQPKTIGIMTRCTTPHVASPLASSEQLQEPSGVGEALAGSPSLSLLSYQKQRRILCQLHAPAFGTANHRATLILLGLLLPVFT